MDTNKQETLDILKICLNEIEQELRKSNYYFYFKDEKLSFKGQEIDHLLKYFQHYLQSDLLLCTLCKLTKQTKSHYYFKELLKALILPQELFQYTSKPQTTLIKKELSRLQKTIQAIFKLLESHKVSEETLNFMTITQNGKSELKYLAEFIGHVYHTHYNSQNSPIEETISSIFSANVSETSASLIPELQTNTPLSSHTLSGITNRNDPYKNLISHTIRSIIEISYNNNLRLTKNIVIDLINSKILIEKGDQFDEYFTSEDYLNSVFQNFKSSIQKRKK